MRDLLPPLPPEGEPRRPPLHPRGGQEIRVREVQQTGELTTKPDKLLSMLELTFFPIVIVSTSTMFL